MCESVTSDLTSNTMSQARLAIPASLSLNIMKLFLTCVKCDMGSLLHPDIPMLSLCDLSLESPSDNEVLLDVSQASLDIFHTWRKMERIIQ